MLKDFKAQGRFDVDAIRVTMELADYLGVRANYDKLMPQIPSMRIEPRYKESPPTPGHGETT